MKQLDWQPLRVEDVEAVAALEKICFNVPWSEQAFRDEIKNPLAVYMIGLADGQLVAYAGMWLVCGEADITNIAVLPAWRGRGIGAALIKIMAAKAKDGGASSMTLEVREGNRPALRLYEKLGFVQDGVRKGYYQDTREDARIMWLRGQAFMDAAAAARESG